MRTILTPILGCATILSSPIVLRAALAVRMLRQSFSADDELPAGRAAFAWLAVLQIMAVGLDQNCQAVVA